MCSILLATYGLWMLPICHHVKSREQKLSSCTSRDVCNLSYIVWTSNHLNFLSLGSSTIHEGVYILLNSVYYCMFQIFLLYTSRKWMSVEKAGVFFLRHAISLVKTEQLCICCFYGCVYMSPLPISLVWLICDFFDSKQQAGASIYADDHDAEEDEDRDIVGSDLKLDHDYAPHKVPAPCSLLLLGSQRSVN